MIVFRVALTETINYIKGEQTPIIKIRKFSYLFLLKAHTYTQKYNFLKKTARYTSLKRQCNHIILNN